MLLSDAGHGISHSTLLHQATHQLQQLPDRMQEGVRKSDQSSPRVLIFPSLRRREHAHHKPEMNMALLKLMPGCK